MSLLFDKNVAFHYRYIILFSITPQTKQRGERAITIHLKGKQTKGRGCDIRTPQRLINKQIEESARSVRLKGKQIKRRSGEIGRNQKRKLNGREGCDPYTQRQTNKEKEG